MDITSLSPIQQEISKALTALGDKARYSETVLAKKIRENAKIDGKKKAGIALSDLEKAVLYLEENSGVHFALIMNSANDLLIEKTEESRPMAQDVRARRLKSEKAMSIFTNADLSSKNGGGKKIQKRSDRKRLSVNRNFDDYDDE